MTIELRYEDCGFVYTDRTRMLFAPKHTATRNPDDRASTDLVISATSNHPEPTKVDVRQILAELAAHYPDRHIFAETSEGLVEVAVPSSQQRANQQKLAHTTPMTRGLS